MPLDTRGVHQFDELDSETTFSELLNLGMGSVSTALKYLAGPGEDREAISPAPRGMLWQDTDGVQALYSVDDTGKWRQQEGVLQLPTANWAIEAPPLYSRNHDYTLPVRLSADEYIELSLVNSSSYLVVHVGTLTRNASTTRVGVLLTQFHRRDSYQHAIAWRIVRKGA